MKRIYEIFDEESKVNGRWNSFCAINYDERRKVCQINQNIAYGACVFGNLPNNVEENSVCWQANDCAKKSGFLSNR